MSIKFCDHDPKVSKHIEHINTLNMSTIPALALHKIQTLRYMFVLILYVEEVIGTKGVCLTFLSLYMSRHIFNDSQIELSIELCAICTCDKLNQHVLNLYMAH